MEQGEALETLSPDTLEHLPPAGGTQGGALPEAGAEGDGLELAGEADLRLPVPAVLAVLEDEGEQPHRVHVVQAVTAV